MYFLQTKNYKQSFYSHLQNPKIKYNRLKNKFFRENDERTLVSEIAVLARKWSKITMRKKVYFWVWVKISSCILSSGGGPVAVTIGVSDI